MSDNKKRALIVCPGRGSYTKESLGYLQRRGQKVTSLLEEIDRKRQDLGRPKITELDSMEKFKPSLHTKGEHASSLIYACSYADYSQINFKKYEPVAITGNSMGWYSACVLAKVLNPMAGFEVIETMGSMMKERLIGGQLIYPLVDENWKLQEEKREEVLKLIEEANRTSGFAEISIFLGGYVVIGADKEGMGFLLKNLPKNENYPLQLINHGAFHTSLLREVSEKAFASLRVESFGPPDRDCDLIDGRGYVWKFYLSNRSGGQAIYDYTLGHQVYKPYDFTQAITKGLKEYNPDCVIILGPGNSLGGVIGQVLVDLEWAGIKGKSDFVDRQKGSDPLVFSMGIEEQYWRVKA